jgi:hypothetical protein
VFQPIKLPRAAYTPLGSTRTYNAIANIHTLEITSTTAKLFPACCVLTSRSLATASKSGALWSSCHSHQCRTHIRYQLRYSVISSQPPLQSSAELLTFNSLSIILLAESQSQSQSHIATEDQSVSKSWYRAPSWCPWPDIYCSSTVTVLFLRGALSDERMGLSFKYAAGPCQRSVSRVLAPWDLRPYFTVSHLRHPFSSPPTTRRVTVESTVSFS